MQVIDNKALLVNTKFPERITGAITKSKVIKQDEEITRVLVNWEFEEAKILKDLRFKNVPSEAGEDKKSFSRMSSFNYVFRMGS